jgi:hypothetical protein
MRLVRSIEISICVQKGNIRPTERKEKNKSICRAEGVYFIHLPSANSDYFWSKHLQINMTYTLSCFVEQDVVLVY